MLREPPEHPRTPIQVFAVLEVRDQCVQTADRRVSDEGMVSWLEFFDLGLRPTDVVTGVSRFGRCKGG